MYCNLKSLKIERLESGSLEFYVEFDDTDQRINFIIGESAYRDFLLRLNNHKTHYPFFDDGIWLIQPHARGIRILRIYTYLYSKDREYQGEYKEFNLVFPGSTLADWTKNAYDWDSFEVDTKMIKRVSESVSPRVYWEYNLPDGFPFAETLVYPCFKKCLNRLQSIAENHSDGNVINISLSIDMYFREKNPAGFFFQIYDPRDNNRRQGIIHGGIIPHANKEGEYEYSIHT